jgi:hypothetical protein
MKWLLGLVVVALCAFVLGGYVLAVEEPSFQVVLKDGAFEVRDYPALVVAETTVTGGQREAAGQGFRRLAGYIFGGNRGAKKIAMTAPVAQQPAGEKIAMTAPVAQMRTGDAWVVRFTMPSGYTLATLPEPNDPNVKLRETPPTRYAVVRFSGLARPDAVANETAALSAWIARRQFQPTGTAILAQYNPPWTLWFLRRNEVMIPISSN